MSSIEITSQPPVYDAELRRSRRSHRGFHAVTRGSRRSYVEDYVNWKLKGDGAAGERLEQNMREVQDAEDLQREEHPDATYEFEARAVNWATGSGGYFAPPLWLIREFAVAPRAERVLADMIPSFDLPEGVQTVNVPRMTNRNLAAAGDLGTSVQAGDDVDVALTSPVATVSAEVDVPLQLLEQSPQGAHLDWIIFSDLEAAYDFRLEHQLINGSGTGGQLLGLLNDPNVPSTNKVAYTGGNTSASSMFDELGSLLASVARNRRVAPECWLMTTMRLAWIASSEDAQSRPLMISNIEGPGKFDLLTIPGEHDNAIPENLGAAGAFEDRIILVRPSDWILLESAARTRVLTEVLSGAMGARLQLHRYAAAVDRYPQGTGWLYGSGMTLPSGF